MARSHAVPNVRVRPQAVFCAVSQGMHECMLVAIAVNMAVLGARLELVLHVWPALFLLVHAYSYVTMCQLVFLVISGHCHAALPVPPAP